MSALQEYLELRRDTESPTQFHRWCFLSGVGAALGRKLWLAFGHKKIYPSQYILLVGVPATRKSTAIAMCRELLEKAQYQKFSYTKTTREKFLLDFEDGFDVKRVDGKVDMVALLDRDFATMNAAGSIVQEVYINCSEFVDFIGRNPIAFVDLLTNIWDSLPVYEERLKNSKSVSIPNPTVNLLGGITPSTLSEALPPNVVGQGFMSRMLLVFSNPTKKRISFPEAPDAALTERLTGFFRDVQLLSGEVKLHPSARELLDNIYQSWPNLPDVRLQYYCGRRFEHLLKLCIIIAASKLSKIVTVDCVVEANTILTWTERSMHLALGEFGESRNSKAAQKVMEAIALADHPLDFSELWKVVSMDLDRRTQLQELIQNLVAAEKLEVMQLEGRTCVKQREKKSRAVKIGVDYRRFISEYDEIKAPRTSIVLLEEDTEHGDD